MATPPSLPGSTRTGYRNGTPANESASRPVTTSYRQPATRPLSSHFSWAHSRPLF
jgi:hypothetical protein